MSAVLDVVVVATIVLSGCLIVGRNRDAGLFVLPAGTVVGIALLMGLTHIAVLLGLNSPGLVAFFATPAIAAWIARKRMPSIGWLPFAFCIGFALRALAVPYTYLRHVDSVNYMIISGLLLRSDGDLGSEVNSLQLQKRMLGTATLHAMQALTDVPMSILLGPWVGLMILLTAFLTVRAIGSKCFASTSIALLTVLALATSSRFLMHVTYLNSHLLNGLAVLVVVSASVQLSTVVNADRYVLEVVVSACAVLVMTRPEGFLLAAIVLVAMLFNLDVSRQFRVDLARGYGFAVILTFTTLLRVFAFRDELAFNSELVYPLLLGVLIVLVSASFEHTGWLSTPYGVAVSGVAFLLFSTVLVLRDLELFREMWSAWSGNYITEGHWGLTIAIGYPAALLSGILIWSNLRIRVPFLIVLVLPVFGLVTSILRAAPGRISDADSFNRMTMHVFPTVIALIGMAGASVVTQLFSGPRR